jgi:hypothetical protein
LSSIVESHGFEMLHDDPLFRRIERNGSGRGQVVSSHSGRDGTESPNVARGRRRSLIAGVGRSRSVGSNSGVLMQMRDGARRPSAAITRPLVGVDASHLLADCRQRRVLYNRATMSRLLAAFVALILVIALPLQGVAAAAQRQCAPAGAPATIAPAHAFSVAHTHADGGSPHLHAPAPAGTGDAASPSGDWQDPPSEDVPCASCETCCGGAVIAGIARAAAPPSAAAGASFSFVPARYSDHVPERLERPPHTFLV